VGIDLRKGEIFMWKVWDKATGINGVSAERYLANMKHLANEETIFIKYVNGRAVQVEGKNILASVYGIDATLDNDAFIAEYEKAIAIEETAEEVTEE
jgi:hypothetical protein